ncbi:hypothetical protein DIPPA_34207 [Diplonema papillatum]|nr:hypothetical protein DIPPA_34207 [Diplonema papillatum]
MAMADEDAHAQGAHSDKPDSSLHAKLDLKFLSRAAPANNPSFSLLKTVASSVQDTITRMEHAKFKALDVLSQGKPLGPDVKPHLEAAQRSVAKLRRRILLSFEGLGVSFSLDSSVSDGSFASPPLRDLSTPRSPPVTSPWPAAPGKAAAAADVATQVTPTHRGSPGLQSSGPDSPVFGQSFAAATLRKTAPELAVPGERCPLCKKLLLDGYETCGEGGEREPGSEDGDLTPLPPGIAVCWTKAERAAAKDELRTLRGYTATLEGRVDAAAAFYDEATGALKAENDGLRARAEAAEKAGAAATSFGMSDEALFGDLSGDITLDLSPRPATPESDGGGALDAEEDAGAADPLGKSIAGGDVSAGLNASAGQSEGGKSGRKGKPSAKQAEQLKKFADERRVLEGKLQAYQQAVKARFKEMEGKCLSLHHTIFRLCNKLRLELQVPSYLLSGVDHVGNTKKTNAEASEPNRILEIVSQDEHMLMTYLNVLSKAQPSRIGMPFT